MNHFSTNTICRRRVVHIHLHDRISESFQKLKVLGWTGQGLARMHVIAVTGKTRKRSLLVSRWAVLRYLIWSDLVNRWLVFSRIANKRHSKQQYSSIQYLIDNLT